jgi:hypothetical protein
MFCFHQDVSALAYGEVWYMDNGMHTLAIDLDYVVDF